MPVDDDLREVWGAALAPLRSIEVMVLHAHRESVVFTREGDRAVLRFESLPDAGAAWVSDNVDTSELAAALSDAVPVLHDRDTPGSSGMRGAEALAVPARTLADYGVVLSDEGDPDPADWRLVVEGPIFLMTSATGLHGRGFRYFIAVWPGPGSEQAAFVALALVKLYASGGREGVITVAHVGNDAAEAVRAVNAALAGGQGSPRFAAGYQPPGCRPLDERVVVEALRRGERVTGPDWDELDAAALRGYGATRSEGWAEPGTPCVMKYTRWHSVRW